MQYRFLDENSMSYALHIQFYQPPAPLPQNKSSGQLLLRRSCGFSFRFYRPKEVGSKKILPPAAKLRKCPQHNRFCDWAKRP